ncbi:MAG: peptide ABC transporter permease [Zestosphaera tikiterensis]|uniref:Peptide ABC transporter permease n=1 Tax=Zestosphaera tikiterensis TaxID=1973259 RepID=A0A2R7Y4H7_9CREN|nr:MAG: peptide ABC transporter permease [Zestosphaera tikiterensis]
MNVKPMLQSLSEFWRVYRENKLGMAGLIIIVVYVIIAILAPYITFHNPSETNPSKVFLPPNKDYWFGTNEVGQDLYALNIYGTRISLIVGFLAALVATFIGTTIGLVSGYYGGLLDEILMRTTDFFLVIPPLVLMIVVGAILGPSMTNAILIIGMLSWSPTARVVRSMTLSVKERPFIESAKAIGASDFTIIFKHILPNVMPAIWANMTLAVSTAIFSYAAMIFLGVGDVNDVSWGMILHYAFTSGALSAGMWWYFVPPGLFIVLLTFAFVLVGYSLEELFNPKLRRF